jgi:hypothetical protein
MSPSPPMEVPPPVPPTPEPPRSASWMKGYNDGYAGVWIAPVRWVVVDEYRAGWNAGKDDRANGKPHRFNSK